MWGERFMALKVGTSIVTLPHFQCQREALFKLSLSSGVLGLMDVAKPPELRTWIPSLASVLQIGLLPPAPLAIRPPLPSPLPSLEQQFVFGACLDPLSGRPRFSPPSFAFLQTDRPSLCLAVRRRPFAVLRRDSKEGERLLLSWPEEGKRRRRRRRDRKHAGPIAGQPVKATSDERKGFLLPIDLLGKTLSDP